MAKWRFGSGNIKKFFMGAVCFCFILALYIGTSFSNHKEDEKPRGNVGKLNNENVNEGHHLAIIVPFRERFEELLVFAPYIHRHLLHKGITHEIIVVNQVDTYRFNRASLINVGFHFATTHESRDEGKSKVDYIVMHDVDLLPLNQHLPYEFPVDNSVVHIAAPGLHPKYDYPTFIGGILAISVHNFRLVNGMSNVYWGWGLEDDEFYVRLKQNNIQVKRPTGINTGKTDTFRHTHSVKKRPRDMTRCFDQYNKTRRRDRLTGLDNVDYTLLSISHLTIDTSPVVVLNVKLACNTQLTPWCNCGSNQTVNKEPASVIQLAKNNIKKKYGKLKKS